VYLWDWAMVPEPGPRFENFVACQLLKYCHFDEDSEGYSTELRFLRDVDKRELDFVVVRDGKPLFSVECKTGERAVSRAALYFQARAALGDVYQVHLGARDYLDRTGRIRLLPFEKLCKELSLP
jgi:predicted AAA+ superfamily ATPase